MKSRFRAVLISKDASNTQSVNDVELGLDDLMEGDVTVAVSHSTVNYKDGLAITGRSPVVRKFPMIPGIDLAGTVETSTNARFKPGDKVLVNGFGLSETHYGGYSEVARVKGDWLVPLAAGVLGSRCDGDRHRGLYGDALCAGAGRRRHHAGEGPDRGDGRVGRRGLRGHRDPRQARISRDRLDRPSRGRGLSQSARRQRDHPPKRIGRRSAPARQGTLGWGRRQRRFEDARQCHRVDAIWRRGRVPAASRKASICRRA